MMLPLLTTATAYGYRTRERMVLSGEGEGATGQAGVLDRSTVAQIRPATMRPAARGSDAVHVAPIKRTADRVRITMVQDCRVER